MTSTSIGSASRALVAAFAAIVLVATAAHDARADNKQVVLMKFKGPKAKALRKAVLKVLKRKVKLVGQAKFVRMQRKLRAKRITKRNVKKVAQRLKVHGVVFGKVTRRRGRYKLNLELRSADDGAVVKSVTLKLGRRPRLTKAKLRQLRKKLFGPIEDLPDPYAEPEPEPEDDGGGWSDEGDGDDSYGDSGGDEDTFGDERGGDEDAIGGDEGGDDTDANVDKDSDDGEPPALYDALARDRAVDVAAGLSVVGRSLSFDVAAGVADQPNGYNGTIVPGAFVQAEVYPLAWNKKNKKSALTGIGAAVVVDKVLKISSKLEGGAVDIPTTQLRWGVGVRYRINLGDKPSSPTVKLGVGYNKLAFELDQQVIADNMLDIDLPNVSYTYLDPGVAGRLPISREMAIYADGRFLIVTDTGDIQGADAYGAATVSGLDFDGGLEYRFDARLLMRAGVRYQRIAFSFDGTGALSDRDGDGSSDVSGATDQYFGGYAVAGYLF